MLVREVVVGGAERPREDHHGSYRGAGNERPPRELCRLLHGLLSEGQLGVFVRFHRSAYVVKGTYAPSSAKP